MCVCIVHINVCACLLGGAAATPACSPSSLINTHHICLSNRSLACVAHNRRGTIARCLITSTFVRANTSRIRKDTHAPYVRPDYCPTRPVTPTPRINSTPYSQSNLMRAGVCVTRNACFASRHHSTTRCSIYLFHTFVKLCVHARACMRNECLNERDLTARAFRTQDT